MPKKPQVLKDFFTDQPISFPADVERDITTPHDHETKRNKPLWLIWVRPKEKFGKDTLTDFPMLDSVCDSELSARRHYLMAREGATERQVYVERVPANHRFASSLGDWQIDAHQALWKLRAERNKREGD